MPVQSATTEATQLGIDTGEDEGVFALELGEFLLEGGEVGEEAGVFLGGEGGGEGQVLSSEFRVLSGGFSIVGAPGTFRF